MRLSSVHPLLQIQQQCCDTPLTALGICCEGSVDDCGVCGGDNSCDMSALLAITVSTSLGPTDPVFNTASYQNFLAMRALSSFVSSAFILSTPQQFSGSSLAIVQTSRYCVRNQL